MNTTPFTFSIKTALREAWALFKKHLGFFLGVALISVLLSVAGGGERTPILISVILTIASFLWGMIWIKISLAAARGDEAKLSFGAIHALVPSVRQVLSYIGVAILTGLIVLCGLILLIIPGLYIMVRLSLASMVYLDRKEGIRKSLRYSWDITKGYFGKILLVGLVSIGLYLLGILALGIGLFVAYPLAAILMAKFYLALSAHYDATRAVIEQPVEIPAEL
ncbi:MAG: hypothetical protein KBB91_01815 [Candidatus Pacebacteria bacterium]|jgi:uncharacterized membrane protein|nr:hypothetical protein [Candidatus Paceibacterota bacterium]MBP9701257.1 hypothetical protein [Candidatus Paceibacterota bacterium]